MNWIDSHTHIYLPEFKEDIDQVIQRAKDQGFSHLLLPAIDRSTFDAMFSLSQRYPSICLPMMAVHPGSIKEDWREEIAFADKMLKTHSFCAIGETGIDLYWDVTHREAQVEAFEQHIQWSVDYHLPLVIHSRNSFASLMDVLKTWRNKELRGVFHCFTGNEEEARQVLDLGFFLGIGGILTYKNSGLDKLVQTTGLSPLILETDAPFLPPVPHRGKRNEPVFLLHTAKKLAETLGVTLEEVSRKTRANTMALFNIT